jgi:hypothetical protein
VSYEDIVEGLGALQSKIGSPEQRCATAHLALAMFHYEFVVLARALKAKGYEVSVYEDASEVRIRLNGTSVTVGRFSVQSELRIEFLGFDPRVVPQEARLQRTETGLLTVDEVRVLVEKSVRAIGASWQHELSLRHR